MIEAETVEIDGLYAPCVDMYGHLFTPPDTVALFRRVEDAYAHAESIARILNRLSWRNQWDFIHNMEWVERAI